MSTAEKLDLALRSVRRACRVTRLLQDDLRAERDVLTKSDASPVTVADLAAQAVVALELGEELVGEESAASLDGAPALAARVLELARAERPELDAEGLRAALRRGEAEPAARGFWTLDPIDGTKGYVRGAHYCVSLAWIEGGRPLVGVLGCPRLGADPGQLWGEGALVWAVRDGPALIAPLGAGSSARGLDPLGRPTDDPVRVAESAESAHSDHSLGGRLVEAAGLASGEPVRIDSQVKYAVVARGDAEVLLRRPRSGYVEKIWDHAAGSLIAEAAGLTVSDLDGRPLDFSAGRELTRNRGLLVARPELHGRLRSALGALES